MTDSEDSQAGRGSAKEFSLRDFALQFLRAIVRDLVFIVLVFLVATGATALVCWYYEVPLFLSLIGGFLVLGIALALKSDSIFD